jgi:hypothetical protein
METGGWSLDVAYWTMKQIWLFIVQRNGASEEGTANGLEVKPSVKKKL